MVVIEGLYAFGVYGCGTLPEMVEASLLYWQCS
jgi:hypothetical protein